jgi:hypothetical protein
LDVEKDGVRFLFDDRGQRLRAAGAFADDLDFGRFGQKSANAFAGEGFVRRRSGHARAWRDQIRRPGGLESQGVNAGHWDTMTDGS